jgi:hypothetical protein
MLIGRFGKTSGRPYLEGRLGFPGLGKSGSVSFLVDTGADCTVLMPADAVKIGIDYSSLRNPTVSVGLGGLSNGYNENAFAAFSDEQNVYFYAVRVHIAIADPDIMSLPSLLGRDIIQHWEAIFDFSYDRLQMNVRYADTTTSISKPS